MPKARTAPREQAQAFGSRYPLTPTRIVVAPRRAELVDRQGSVDVLMGVDADDDLAGTKSFAHGMGLQTG